MSKNILIYDAASIPKGLTMRQICQNFKENNIVIWCSSSHSNLGGKDIENPPLVLDKESLDKAEGIKFIDTADLSEDQIKELKG